MSTVRGYHLCYLSIVGDIMIHVGGYHEYREVVRYHGGTQMTNDEIPSWY